MSAHTIIPKPVSLQPAEGAFSLNDQTGIGYSMAAYDVATYLAEALRIPTGFPLPLQEIREDAQTNQAILLRVAGSRDGDRPASLADRSDPFATIIAASPIDKDEAISGSSPT